MSRLQALRDVLSDVDLLVSTALALALVMGGFGLVLILGVRP